MLSRPQGNTSARPEPSAVKSKDPGCIDDYSRRIILFLRKLFQEGLNDLICRHIFCFRLKVEQTAVTKCW